MVRIFTEGAECGETNDEFWEEMQRNSPTKKYGGFGSHLIKGMKKFILTIENGDIKTESDTTYTLSYNRLIKEKKEYIVEILTRCDYCGKFSEIGRECDYCGGLLI